MELAVVHCHRETHTDEGQSTEQQRVSRSSRHEGHVVHDDDDRPKSHGAEHCGYVPLRGGPLRLDGILCWRRCGPFVSALAPF